MRKQTKTAIKGALSNDDIYFLNNISSDMLSDMFDVTIPNMLTLPVVSGRVSVFIPASNRTVSISESERDDVAAAIAYSTLNQLACEYMDRDGSLIRLFALGFTNDQVTASGSNHYSILCRATPDMYSILN